MTLVTKYAPNFIAPAILKNGTIINKFNFHKEIKNKITVLFFWPMDFTFVCPTEIIAFNKLYSEFKKRKTKIIGVSRDSVFVHNAWKNTPIKQGGIGNIQYTMVSDIQGIIQNDYNVTHPHIGVALRASFLIDKYGIIRHEIINDLPFGRNIHDIIRMIDAIIFHDQHGDVCPANWEKGQRSLQPSNEGLIQYFNK
ncbi:redoxin domain-containing protein [Buchnera aphidicola]|uniref:Thioredoxin peroxidase n=1 Tax=Buchnera aphidicola (Stegophylla sp.) TaxID=2315800 RepID=A0A4D6YK48_9GAMM|nr:redoxin domain-containing protein [Buchnera aphidicola (Stegophylla sp.)]QCI26314.1 peroxiredoxin [Buchnera aphidicola (Stegophylla sp.)]